MSTITGLSNTISGRTTIGVGDSLIFDPNASTTLTIDAVNLIIEGGLQMRPANAGIIHTIRFINVNEAGFVGGAVGGMGAPIDSDPGLWVMNAGVFDVVGTPKAGWNRTGDDASWQVGDEMFKTPWNVGDFTTFAAHTKGGALQSLVGPDGVTYKQEAFNLTRNVRIEGTPGHNSHLFIRTDVPQTIKWMATRYLAPRLPVAGQSISVKIRGRWGMHLHHLGNAGYDTLIEGVVVRDNGAHCFVPHGTFGPTFRDCIAFVFNEEAYWWDFEVASDLSKDVVYDHCMAARFVPIPSFRGISVASFRMNAELLGSPLAGECFDCVAVGNMGATNSSGFGWPSGPPDSSLPQPLGLWDFHDNISHNNRRDGIFFWSNDARDHRLQTTTCFRNGGAGIQTGAYRNQVRVEDLVLFANGDSFQPFCDFNVIATSAIPGNPAARPKAKGIIAPAIAFTERVLSTVPGVHGLLLDCDFGTASVDENFSKHNESAEATPRPGDWDLVRCGLEPGDWNVISMFPPIDLGILPYHTRESIYRVQRDDDTAYRVMYDGSHVDILPFWFYVVTQALPPGTASTPYSQPVVSALGSGGITWGLASGSGALPTGCTLSSGGTISGTPTTPGTYNFTVEATDTLGYKATKDLSIQVVSSGSPLQITAADLDDGVLGIAYSDSVTAVGGTAPLVWDKASGNLPPGLALTSNGALTGTPTSTGVSKCTLRVTDALAVAVTHKYSILVVDNTLVISTAPALRPAEKKVEYDDQIHVSGGTGPYVLTKISGALPAGIVMSPTGALTGMPRRIGSFPFRVRATDAVSATGEEDFTITVAQPLHRITGIYPVAFRDTPYRCTLHTGSGVSPYLFTVVGDENIFGDELLPPGLFMSFDGVLSGTPEATGIYPFTVQVFDAAGGMSSLDVVFVVLEGGQVSFSRYASNRINNAICNNQPLQVPQLYAKLHTENPGEDCEDNPAINTTRRPVSFGDSLDEQCLSDTNTVWSNVPSSEIYSHISLWDDPDDGQGNPWGYGPAGTPASVTAGQDFQIDAGDISFGSD